MRRFKKTPDFRCSDHTAREPSDQKVEKIRWYYTTVGEDLAARVKNYAQRLTYNRSTIISMALQEFLDRHEG